MPRLHTRITAAIRGLKATLRREFAATRLVQLRQAIQDNEATICELQIELAHLRLAEEELRQQFEPDTPAYV